MKKSELGQRIKHELQGMIRLSPLVLALLVVMAILWRTDSVANSGLFQSSPVSPVETPATLTSTPTVEVLATATSTQPPTQPPTVVPSPDATGTSEISTVAPTESVVPLETPTEAVATETASPEATLTPTELPVTDTPVAPVPSETMEPQATEAEGDRYPEGESNLKFEWGMLFDSLALFFSYAWLFCGILLFISVPVLFFILWRSSAQRQEEEATSEEAEQQKVRQEGE